MNILLVKLPTLLAPKSFSYFGSVPPLGLAYIAGILKQDGHRVSTLDAAAEGIELFRVFAPNPRLLLHGLTVEEMIGRIPSDIQVIGVTNMFLHESNLLRDFANAVKKVLPHVTIIAGGENLTASWSQMLDRSPGLDICILGEGEAKMSAVISAIEKNEPYENIEGIAYRRDGVPFKTGAGARITKVDSLPWPAWELFNIEPYMEQRYSSGVNRGRSIPMLSSRGCPFTCKFCSSPEMWTTKYQARDPEDVVKEIKFYVQKYSITNVDFNDLTSVLTRSWIRRFAEAMKRENVVITWQLPQGSRSEVIDDETARWLYETGCRNYNFSPESGSERMLKSMEKRVKVDKIMTAMKIARRNGLHSQASIILALPEESPKDLVPTLWMLVRLAWMGIDAVAVMPFVPYPGSEYYKELMHKGEITWDDTYIYSVLQKASLNIRSFNPHYTRTQILLIQYFFLLTFYGLNYIFRPLRAFDLIKKLFKNQQETILDKFLHNKTKQIREYLKTDKIVISPK